LLNRALTCGIEADCAQTGRRLDITVDRHLSVLRMPSGAEPMVCFPIVELATTSRPGIVDIF
jgi:hypothetical protein